MPDFVWLLCVIITAVMRPGQEFVVVKPNVLWHKTQLK